VTGCALLEFGSEASRALVGVVMFELEDTKDGLVGMVE
jgi:hypothetical protein